jgi:hypothetical protein
VALRKGSKIPHELVFLNEHCSVVDSSPADPDNAEARFVEEHLHLAADLQTLGYLVRNPPLGARWLFIRRVHDLTMLDRFEAPANWIFRDFVFTGDSATIVADVFYDPDDRKVQIYSLGDGKLLREVKIDASIGLAISSDSRLLAAGQRKHQDPIRSMRAQDSVVLYDFETGQELTRIEFPEVADWFMDGVLSMYFAGNECLITSNRHTQVWKINRLGSR